jgi:hypothetical protein
VIVWDRQTVIVRLACLSRCAVFKVSSSLNEEFFMTARDVVFPPGARICMSATAIRRPSAPTASCSFPARSAACLTDRRAGTGGAGASGLRNLNEILAAAGSSFEQVVDVTVFMSILKPLRAHLGRGARVLGQGAVSEYHCGRRHRLAGFDFEIKVIAKAGSPE